MAKVLVADEKVTFVDRGGRQTSLRVVDGDWLRAVAQAPKHLHAARHERDGKALRAPGARDYMRFWVLRRYVYGDARRNTLLQAEREADRISEVLGDTRIDKVTPSDCQAVMDSVSRLGSSSQKVTRKLLRAAFTDAVKVGALGHRLTLSPADVVDISSSERAQPGEFLRFDEIPRFLDAVAGRPVANAARLMLLCGLRIGEACSVRWPQVELGEHWAPCRGVLRFGDEVKERRGKLVPIPETCVLDVVDAHRVSPIGDAAVRLEVARAVKAAGIDRDVTPHGLRRTFARVMHYRYGATLMEVRDLLGHSDVRTTMRYLEGGSEDVLGKVALMGGAV